MRILFVSRTLPYLGGREVVVDKLIDYFSHQGKVMVLTPDSTFRRSGVKILSTKLSFQRIRSYVAKFKPEVISCHTFYLSDMAIKLAKLFNIPLVFTFHGVFIRFYGKDYRSTIRRIYKNSYCVVTVSQNYQKQLSVFLRDKDLQKIVLIRNGISEKQISRSNLNIASLRGKYNLPLTNMNRNDLLFLFSSPKGRKNQEEKEFKVNLLRLVKRYRLPAIFRNYSRVDLQKIFSACDICLMPSLVEGISLSILESMAAGLVVVATRVGGTPEIIESGINGFLIKPKCARDIASTIEVVLNLTQKRQNLIINKARKRVKSSFSEIKMLSLYKRLFNNVLTDFNSNTEIIK